MAEIIILANSDRPGGYCIAGIDRISGEWVRPVARWGRAIPGSAAEKIKLLDVVEIPLASERPRDPYQRENRFVASRDWGAWGVVGNMPPKEVLKYCEDATVILHSHNDRVNPTVLEALPFEQWKSLQLVRREVKFSRDNYKHYDWRASFYDDSGHLLSLKVTDPKIEERLNGCVEIGNDCILTISLAAPWAPPNGSQPERCYKLVAGVIEL
ncbi:MAG: hypothetical protein AABX37_03305 [Nanoarchaeota archaeon]